MDDFTALRLAIARHPTDSTPRGMLADWLEERGKAAFALAVRRGAGARLKVYGDGGGYGGGGGDGGDANHYRRIGHDQDDAKGNDHHP